MLLSILCAPALRVDTSDLCTLALKGGEYVHVPSPGHQARASASSIALEGVSLVVQRCSLSQSRIACEEFH